MTIQNIRTLMIALLFASAFGASVQASSPKTAMEATLSTLDIAQAYLQAYEAQDFDRLRGYYSDDAVFIDQTSFGVAQVEEDIHWQGPDAIIAGIKSWGLARGQYRLDRVFESSNIVVFDAEMDAVYETSAGTRIYRYPIITILTIENGKVMEHRDYTAFNNVTDVSEVSEE